jgi:hypothetical protein
VPTIYEMLTLTSSWRRHATRVLIVSLIAAFGTLVGARGAYAIPACQEHVYVFKTNFNGTTTGLGLIDTGGPGELVMNINDPNHHYITFGGEVRPRRSATFSFKDEAGTTVYTKTTTNSDDGGVIHQEPNVIDWNGIAQRGQRLQIFADFHTRCGGDDVMRFNVPVGSIITFPAAPVQVNPKYLVIGVTYAPPGRQSFVDYGGSRTLGSRLSFSESFQGGITFGNTRPTGVTSTISSSTSFTQTGQGALSNSVEKSTSNNIIIPGPLNSLDGIDHNEDLFFVWLNPAVQAFADSFTSILTDGFAVDPRDPISPNTDVVQLSVRELKNPSLIPPGTASRLERSWSPTGALTTADFNDILARNPFADGGTAIDPARFDLLPGQVFEYRPANPGGQPVTQRHTVRFQEAASQSLAFTTSIKSEVTFSNTTSFQIFDNTVKAENKLNKTFQFTASIALDQSTTTNQTTTLSLTGPTSGYQGPTAVQAYQDNMFGTVMFAFAQIPTFQIGAPSPNQTVTQGGGAAYPITTQSDFGFEGTVNFDPNVMGLPAGAQATFSPTSVGVRGGSTLTVTTSPTTPPGTYPLTITASSDLIIRHLTVNLVVNPLPFTLSVAPSTRTINSGQTTTYTVTVNAANGFSGPVQLIGPGGLPPGATATYNPTVINGSGTSTLTVTTAGNTPGGTSGLTIRGVGGGITQLTTATLVVNNAQDFGLAVNPSAAGVAAGDTAVFTVSTTAINGFGGNVNLAVSGLPAGATPSFSVNPIAGAGSSTLNIATTTSVVPDDYLLTITGTSGGITHSQIVVLTVSSPQSNFTLEVTPSAQTAPAGGSATYPVATTAVDGFAGDIGLTVSGMPTGVTGNFNTSSVDPGSGAMLSISVGATAAPGDYPLTVTGTSGSRIHSQTVMLSVPATGSDFTLTLDRDAISIGRGDGAVTWVQTSGDFSDPIELSVTGMPEGVSAFLDTTPVYAYSGSNLYFGLDWSVAPGTYIITITGVSGGISHSQNLVLTVT